MWFSPLQSSTDGLLRLSVKQDKHKRFKGNDDSLFCSFDALVQHKIICTTKTAPAGLGLMLGIGQLPWSQRFFVKRTKKTSGNSGTESHFHAVDSCQICHLSNYTINQSPGVIAIPPIRNEGQF